MIWPVERCCQGRGERAPGSTGTVQTWPALWTNPEVSRDQSEVPRRVSQTAPEAITDPKGYYDQRYAEGYMQDFDDLFEACRLLTVRQILGAMRARGAKPRSVLDYGCGKGRYLGILREFFPEAAVTGCDISGTGLSIARRFHPDARFIAMADETIALQAGHSISSSRLKCWSTYGMSGVPQRR